MSYGVQVASNGIFPIQNSIKINHLVQKLKDKSDRYMKHGDFTSILPFP
jgi:hypothetical protein